MVRWHEARAVPAGSPSKWRGACPGLSGSCPLRTRAVKVPTSRLLQFSDSLAAKREAQSGMGGSASAEMRDGADRASRGLSNPELALRLEGASVQVRAGSVDSEP